MSKKINIQKFVALIMTIGLFGGALLTTPVSTEQSQGENGGNQGGSAQSQKNENAIKGCENVEEKVKKVSNKFQQQQESHVQTYEQIQEKVQNYINYAEENGGDVSELQVHLQVMEQNLEQLKQQAKLQQQQLNQLKTNACGAASGEFKNTLFRSRQQMREVSYSDTQLKEHIKNNILAEIKNIQKELN